MWETEGFGSQHIEPFSGGMKTHTGSTGILAFVPDLWDAPWQSRHHILQGLSEHYKVLWVSPPSYWETIRTGQGRPLAVGTGICRISPSLWAYAPRVPADYRLGYGEQHTGTWRDGAVWCFRHYHELWQAAHVAQIRRFLHQMGIERVILYLWRPQYGWTRGRFSEVLTCYHVDDEYTFNPEEEEPISATEMALLKASDMVFVHSRTLMAKKGSINPNTHYLPNGVDFDGFRAVMDSAAAEPLDLAAIPRPRIGYVGYLKRHVDLPLLCQIARRRPDWSVVLIGPVREEHLDVAQDVARLKQQANVYCLGYKPYADVPGYIKGLDVCLMNYRRTPYTNYIYPIKLHEYLACGKPVVATPLENLAEFAEVLRFAEDPRQWVAAIEQALKEADPRLPAERVAVARQNSWALRVRTITELFEQRLQGRNSEAQAALTSGQEAC